MTFALLSVYEVGRYDTAESISSAYGVSWRAIKYIPANQHLLYQLPDTGKIATGLRLNIAPHPGRLVRDRLNALHRLRPQLMAHFQRMAERADGELRPLLLAATEPAMAAAVRDKMAELDTAAARDIDTLAMASAALVGICTGMSLTHVATDYDRRAAASAADSLCGLYWLVSVEKFQAWHSLWLLQNWSGRWSGVDGAQAWQALEQLLNTIRSVVMQSVDEKLRLDQRLERQLFSEFAGPDG